MTFCGGRCYRFEGSMAILFPIACRLGRLDSSWVRIR